jgi:hypothetical protein
MTAMRGEEPRSCERAIAELLEPEALEAARARPRETSGYVVWGEYGRILQGYVDVFGADQLLVVFSDELRREPERVLAEIHGFIGVDPTFVPDNLGERYRVGSDRKRLARLNPYQAQERMAGSGLVRRLWHALPERARRQVDQAFDGASYRLDLWNRRRRGTAEPDSVQGATLTLLRDHFHADARLLTELVGRTPSWLDSEVESAWDSATL